MEKFSELNKIDLILIDTTGATVAKYAYPNYDMSMFDRADFIINCPLLSMATATAAGNECILTAAVYTATAATSTSLTALSSATASFGSTDAPGVAGANMLMYTFATASTGTTFSLCGKKLKIQSTHCTLVATAATYDVLGGTGLTNATYASALANIVNGTVASFSKFLVAATVGAPLGATYNSSNVCFVWPKDPGSTTLSGGGKYGATANKGVLVAGNFCGHIGVSAAKFPVGGRFINIAINSSGLPTPFTVTLIRSKSRYTVENKGLAVNTDLGSTS
jgi:hypothetical protein